MTTGERVSTYLTLLSTLTLQKSQGHDVEHLEGRLAEAWGALTSAERGRVQGLLRTPAHKPRKRPAFRLVRGGRA